MEFEQIGKYKILGEIGQGAMGHVYKAHDPVLNRYLAIKTISASLGPDEELRKRFHREAQAAARLNHPNIITVHDFGEEQGRIYIAMELLEGPDLKEFISSGALKSLGAKLGIMEQICDGLAFAHSKGVVHRDLKPANIHIQSTGQVKIMDFGLARVDSAEHTKAGVVLGTPYYMSPEQVMGERADFRSDIFSAGAVLYEMLSGRRPFDADSVHSVLYQVVNKQPVPVRQWAADAPAELVAVIEKALSKDPAQRYKDGTELREALRGVRQALSGRGLGATLSGRSGSGVAAQPPVRSSDPAANPAATRPPGAAAPDGVFTEGTVALDLTKSPIHKGERRGAPTLSGRATTRAEPVEEKPAPASRSLAWVGVAAGLVAFLAAAGYYASTRFVKPPPVAVSPSPDAASAQVGALTQALVGTQLELARKNLEDKDYKAAIAQAEQALKLDPRSAEAQRLQSTARTTLAELESAAEEARTALDTGDTEKASQALAKVLALDPKHEVAAEVSARLNRFFRARAEDARKAATQSRGEADKAGVGTRDTFLQGVKLAQAADASLAKQEFAVATQGFLEARDAFDRARRAGTTKPAAGPTAAPQGREQVVLSPGPGRSPAPIVAPTEGPPPLQLPRKAFVVGTTVVQSAKGGGGDLTGFESAGVSVKKTPDFVGRIDFELGAPAVRAGENYSIKAYLVNEGKKSITIKEATIATTENGARSSRPASLAATEVQPRQRVLLAGLGGVWEESLTSWSLELTVTSNKGDSCRNNIAWK